MRSYAVRSNTKDGEPTMKNADMPAMPVYVDNSDWTLRWSIDTGTAKAGDIVGCECGRGYRQFKFKGVRYSTHRVIFFIFNGYMPECVDHIDGNPANNNIANLREATKSQNMINRKTQRNNKAGRRFIKLVDLILYQLNT